MVWQDEGQPGGERKQKNEESYMNGGQWKKTACGHNEERIQTQRSGYSSTQGGEEYKRNGKQTRMRGKLEKRGNNGSGANERRSKMCLSTLKTNDPILHRARERNKEAHFY